MVDHPTRPVFLPAYSSFPGAILSRCELNYFCVHVILLLTFESIRERIRFMETTQNSELKKASFGYLRVSSLGQIEGDGFPRQRETILKFAAANGYEIVRWFEEEGVSGTIADRPALGDLMVALDGGEVHTVMIEKLDRIARDILIQESIVQSLQHQGFDLVSVMEPDLCVADPSRKLMRQIMGAFAEYDREMIVLKTRAARERIRKSGRRCEGRKAFGSAKNPEVRAEEQTVLARITQLRAEGMGFDKLAQTLNAEGCKTRTGARWYPASVRKIAIRNAA
jgi:DNA invertase Pin-like site-specific DNA recombinase